MNDLVLVDILETDHQVRNEEFGLAFVEDSFVTQMIAKVSSVQVVHHQVQVLTILEGAANVD